MRRVRQGARQLPFAPAEPPVDPPRVLPPRTTVRSVEAFVRACSYTVPPPRVSSVRVPPMRVVLVPVFVGLAAD